MSCGVGHRFSLDLAWLWLWQRPAAAALIVPLAGELPCVASAALKKRKKKKKSNSLWQPSFSSFNKKIRIKVVYFRKSKSLRDWVNYPRVKGKLDTSEV